MDDATAAKAVQEHGSIAKAARAIGVHPKTVWTAMRRWKRSNPAENTAFLSEPTASAGSPAWSSSTSAPHHTLDDFKRAYDKDTIIPAKIAQAIVDLGPENWEYEVQFARMAGVALSDIGAYREQFAGHVVVIRRDSKKCWAGSIQLAARMREMVA